jgi:hypothetical protein
MSVLFTPGPCTRIAPHCQPGGWRGGYTPRHPWGATRIQWGTHRDGAFVEACPPEPLGGFIRADASTLAEAEDRAWAKLQRALSCPGHEYERRNYRNGAGFCRHCNRFESRAFEPLERCAVCAAPTYHLPRSGQWYCAAHASLAPDPEPGTPEHATWLFLREADPDEPLDLEVLGEVLEGIAEGLRPFDAGPGRVDS